MGWVIRKDQWELAITHKTPSWKTGGGGVSGPQKLQKSATECAHLWISQVSARLRHLQLSNLLESQVPLSTVFKHSRCHHREMCGNPLGPDAD